MGAKKIIHVDDRGRITVPQEFRNGVDTYSIEIQNDGSLTLEPLSVIPATEAKILESLKTSIDQFKNKDIEDLPEDWIEK